MVTVREFARQVGRDQALILRLAKKGVIPRNEDGTIPLAEGLTAFYEYDSAPKNKGGRPKKGEGKTVKNTESSPASGDKEQQREEAIRVNNASRAAELKEKVYKANLRELEFKEKSGVLKNEIDIADEWQHLADNIKGKLLSAPPRISSMCEGRIAREIEEIFTDAINEALADLQKYEYSQMFCATLAVLRQLKHPFTAAFDDYLSSGIKKLDEEYKG